MFKLLSAATALVLSTPALAAPNQYTFGATPPSGTISAVLTLDGVTPFTVLDTGWIRQDGRHDAAEPNYLTGRFLDLEHRSFFTFALGALEIVSPYTSATLTIQTGGTTGVPFTLDIREVAASYLELDRQRGPNDARGVELFGALAAGTLWGSLPITQNTVLGDGSTTVITLNQAFLDKLNSGLLGEFTFGGSIREVAASNPAVPEPATWAMMIAGFALAGVALRRGHPVAAA